MGTENEYSGVGFSVGIEIESFSGRDSDFYLHFCVVCGPKLLVFIVWIEIDLVFLCGLKMRHYGGHQEGVCQERHANRLHIGV